MQDEDRSRTLHPDVTDEERNRFLTLAMGECWHDYDLGSPVLTCKGGGFICRTCREFIVSNNDFATEEDFSRLWRWLDTVPMLDEWRAHREEQVFPDGPAGRRAFAHTVYELLMKNG